MVLLSQKKIDDLLPLIKNLDNVYTVLCGKNSAYIETKNEKFISILNEYYSKYNIVDDLSTVQDDDFFKIAIYHFESSETYIYPSVKHLENEMLVKISGQHWVDVSHFNANKGFALKLLQEKLNISILLITHDIGLVKHFSEDIVVMTQGRVVESGSSKEVLSNPVHEYTRKLMGAVGT